MLVGRWCDDRGAGSADFREKPKPLYPLLFVSTPFAGSILEPLCDINLRLLRRKTRRKVYNVDSVLAMLAASQTGYTRSRARNAPHP